MKLFRQTQNASIVRQSSIESREVDKQMGFMDFKDNDSTPEMLSPEQVARAEEMVGVSMAEIKEHVDWLLDNNEQTQADGKKQFEYLLQRTPVEMALIIGGLMGYIARNRI